MSPILPPLAMSNASSTATLECAAPSVTASPQPQWPAQQPQQPGQRCPSPIFNYIAKLQISNSTLDDDLEDINNLIDTEVGVENLPMQNEFDNSQIMATFQPQTGADIANKIKVCTHISALLHTDRVKKTQCLS